MEIELKKKTDKVMYGKLQHGDTFLYNEEFYIRIKTCYKQDDLSSDKIHNVTFTEIDCAIRLKDGYASQISIIQVVEPINLKVVKA